MKPIILFFTTFIFVQLSTGQISGWHKVFVGKVNNENYILQLNSADNYNAYVWNADDPIPVFLNIQTEEKKSKDSIKIFGGNPYLSITLNALIQKDTLMGTITIENNEEKSHTYPIHFVESKSFEPFQYYFSEGSAKMRPGVKNKSLAHFNLGSIWPQGNNSVSLSIKSWISEVLKSNNPIHNFPSFLNQKKSEFINDWLKKNAKLSAKELSEFGLSLSEESMGNISVLYEDNRTLSLSRFEYVFTGGAHGMHYTEIANFDKKSGKKLELNDILTEEGINALPQLLDRAARKLYHISNNNPLDDLENGFFVNKIIPNENFYISNTGIGFYFPPYELRSYADGEISLIIPNNDLNKYFKDSFKP